MPKISVIIRVYNRTRHLSLAIKSVLNQTFSDFEIIIIDDNSQIDAEHIVRRFNDKRIKYYKNTNNLGITNALLKGFELAQGEYLTNLDDDDIYLPNNLHSNYEVFDKTNNNTAFVYGRAGILNLQGKLILTQKKYDVNNVTLKFGSIPIIYSCTYMIRKSILHKIQNSIATIPCGDYVDDIRIVITSIKNGYNVLSHNNIIALHRLHKKNYTASIFRTGQYLNDLTTLIIYTTKPHFPYKRVTQYFWDISRRITGFFTYKTYRADINILILWLLKYPKVFISFLTNMTKS